MSILDLYNSKNVIAAAPGDHSRTFNAKDVGTEPGGAVDAINGSVAGTQWDLVQKDFKIKQPLLQTQFTDKGLQYAEQLKVNTTKYAPSGRL
jgi:hypothetical protein